MRLPGTPTFLVGQLGDYHPFENRIQLWKIWLALPVDAKYTMVMLKDEDVWGVPSSTWRAFHQLQRHAVSVSGSSRATLITSSTEP